MRITFRVLIPLLMIAFLPVPALGEVSVQGEVDHLRVRTDKGYEGSGTLYGLSADAFWKSDWLFGAEARGVVGNFQTRPEGVSGTTDRAKIFAGRLVVGKEVVTNGTYIYSGAGYRYLRHPVSSRGDRISHTPYIPVGIMFDQPYGESGWHTRSYVELALIPWSRDKFNKDLTNTSSALALSRQAGYQFRIGVAMRNGMFSIKPFFRYFKQGSAEPDSFQGTTYKLYAVKETEFGVQVGMSF